MLINIVLVLISLCCISYLLPYIQYVIKYIRYIFDGEEEIEQEEVEKVYMDNYDAVEVDVHDFIHRTSATLFPLDMEGAIYDFCEEEDINDEAGLYDEREVGE